MSGRFSRTIYVGNLPADIRESEIEDLFYKTFYSVLSELYICLLITNCVLHMQYGRILDIELKIPPRPPCYCFVEFDNARDAEDAIRGRDGYNFDGCRLRVELAHGGRGLPSSNDRRGSYGGGSGGGGGGRFGASRHSDYRVIVRGLPSSASWQDLKDHMRKAGDVCFAEVSRDGDGTYGLVDYTNYEDMKYAIRKLDDTEFRNPWTRTYIRVKTKKMRANHGIDLLRDHDQSPLSNHDQPQLSNHDQHLPSNHYQHLLSNHPGPDPGPGLCPLARLCPTAPDFVSVRCKPAGAFRKQETVKLGLGSEMHL
ncbi:hypothetical protein BUALT_Bualt06G0136700 [Buddleja alternifolia]|uniref:RRM domain-containing protein n=1 Tax=Buddleja alternifolia TaxID=168488 RepID=A0AAV6XEZ9_9LAMI|nr:hypothetical protein BUALT_Bualt06G0136700 [Buddleja alternifolia]